MSHRSSNSTETPPGQVFDDLPAGELDALKARLSVVNVERGDDVVKLDDHGIAVYFIEEGEAMVVGDPRDETKVLGAGDVVGEISLLLTGERTSTVVALTPMRLLSLSGQDFELIRARIPSLERSLRHLALERAST